KGTATSSTSLPTSPGLMGASPASANEFPCRARRQARHRNGVTMSEQDTTTETTTETTTPEGQAPADGPGDIDALGDAGKKALDAMKAERNAFRTEAREWKQLAKELGVDDAKGLRD